MEGRVVKYVGAGASLPGVPARDLTLDEVKKYRDAIEACTQVLYEIPKAEGNPGRESKKANKPSS